MPDNDQSQSTQPPQEEAHIGADAALPVAARNTSAVFFQVLLAEYLRLQQQSAQEREARDKRVNWYTFIIGGVVAGYGALSGEFARTIADTSLRAFVSLLGVAFLLIVGWVVFEAAQRFNLNAIACLLQMQRIRAVLAGAEPELETHLLWKQEPELGHKRGSWIPAVTVTINSFLVCLIVAIFVKHRLVDGYWQLASVLSGALAAAGQCLYAWRRYRKLTCRFGASET